MELQIIQLTVGTLRMVLLPDGKMHMEFSSETYALCSIINRLYKIEQFNKTYNE